MIGSQEGQGGATIVYERSDPQWPTIWAALGRRIVAEGLGDGTDLVQLHDGEGWQYLCTTIAGDGQRHSFRHRSHPRAGVRVSFDLATRED